MTSPVAPPYDRSGVVVAASALYVAPAYTPLAPDSSILWDPTNWAGKTLTLAGATAITLSVTTALGIQTTASITTPTAANIATALAGLSNVGSTNGLPNVSVSGTVSPFKVVFASALGAVTLAITTSTGGAPTVTDGLWAPAGASEAGWSYSASRQTQDITIEEQSTPVNKFITSTTASVSGNASQADINIIQWAMNASKTQIAQSTGQPAVTVLAGKDTLDHYAVMLETRNRFGLPRRFYIPDVVNADGLTQAFRRNAAQQMVPVSFAALCSPQEIIIRDCTAPGL